MFRVIASTENEFKFSKLGIIDFKLYTYFTEEDAYLPFDRKKIRVISNFEICGFKAHAGGQTYVINSFHT